MSDQSKKLEHVSGAIYWLDGYLAGTQGTDRAPSMIRDEHISHLWEAYHALAEKESKKA